MTDNVGPEASAIAWGLRPLKKYGEFSGRARRKEFWYFNLLISAPIGVLFYLLGALTGRPMVTAIISALIGLPLLPASLGVAVRRLHDTGRSGWWLLVGFIPLVGLLVLIFYCLDGDAGPNAYGDDPKSYLRPKSPDERVVE